ncbi:MAG: ferritin-like domain-containing protein [Alphaproteobacteria bacterium]|nr:ferritin-like domain-containing protein [Alphaproteobacteria bacterium]
MTVKTLCDAALSVLTISDAAEKCRKTRALYQQWTKGDIAVVGLNSNIPDRPARPEKPELRDPRDMPKRGKAGSEKSKIALLHALSHIELNAVDLAWDIMLRFAYLSEENAPKDFSLPKAFFDDWVKVADDEAKHFLMLSERLGDLNASYGDLPAHDGLWESSERTAEDFPARFAVVPMVLEARGLDVTPNMISVMQEQGDHKTADMLQIIHDDEVTHVRAGTVWFENWCEYYDLDIETTFQDLVRRYFYKTLKKPFNHPSRHEAGMLRHWYEPLAEEHPRNAKEAS